MKILQTLLSKKALPPPVLPLEESTEDKSPFFAVGALTHRGCVRDRNEDSLFVMSATLSQEEDLLPTGLYIIADGMGGHEGGDQASAIAVRLVASWVLEKLYCPLVQSTVHSANHHPIHQVLIEAALAANSEINQACPDGGTTLTCAFVLGTNAFIANVGDSRAYLLTRNTIRQITTDHSLVNRLLELGQITPEEAKTHPQRHVLYRALGRTGNVEVDTYLQSLPMPSTLLLCSDGLWETIPPEAVLSIVNAAPSPQIACRRLVARANDSGGQDNVTAILVQIRE